MRDGFVRLRVNGFLLPPLSTRCVDIRFDRLLLLPVQASRPSTHRSSINNSITVRANYQTLPFNRVVPRDSIPGDNCTARNNCFDARKTPLRFFFHGELLPPFSVAANQSFRIRNDSESPVINRFIHDIFSP